MISIIVAIAENGVIGGDNKLLWHISSDLKRFKALTTGNTIVMGRKTYESIGRPLPNRKNIVISRNRELTIEGCEVIHSLEELITNHDKGEELFIIGGGEIYRSALQYADKLYITEVLKSYDGDTSFPEINFEEWSTESVESHKASEKDSADYKFINYIKK